MLRSKFLWQLYTTLGAVVLVSIVVFGTLTLAQLQVDTRANIEHSLTSQATILRHYLRPYLEAGRQLSQSELGSLIEGGSARVTVIDTAGVVMADNRQEPGIMDNHKARPEVLQAMSSGAGVSERFSRTISENMLYVALRVPKEGRLVGFIRVAIPLADLEAQHAAIRNRLVFSAAIILAVFLGIGFLAARRISRPLAQITEGASFIAAGHYDHRLPKRSDDEIGRLSSTLNELARQTEERIEDLMDSRNQLAAILSGLTEGVIAVDMDQKILHINESAGRMLQLQKNVAIRSPLGDVVRVDEIRQAVDTCLSELISVNATVKVRDSTLDVLVAVLRNDDWQSAAGAIVVLEDVTEMLRLEQVRSDFVANASHELKTPISAIRGFVETILDDDQMPEDIRKRFVGRIRSQSMRLDNIVKDLIHLSRFDAYAVRMELSTLDLGVLLRQIQQSKAEDAADTELSFHSEICDKAVEVNGEVKALDQMVVNLIDNAFKYTPVGGTVTLRLSTVGQMAVIEVEDNGIGIPEDERQRIFERFYRVDRGRSREQGGTGLGLSIVKHIAQSHNGSVDLIGEVDKGSTFRVSIPLATKALLTATEPSSGS